LCQKKMQMLLFVFGAILFISTGAEYVLDENERCCESCTVEGEVKYYSIDKMRGYCGECCMSSDDYKKFKIFEPGLTLAEDNAPCADFDYHDYKETVTHGFLSIKMTLDLYNPDDAKFVDLNNTEVKDSGNLGSSTATTDNQDAVDWRNADHIVTPVKDQIGLRGRAH